MRMNQGDVSPTAFTRLFPTAAVVSHEDTSANSERLGRAVYGETHSVLDILSEKVSPQDRLHMDSHT